MAYSEAQAPATRLVVIGFVLLLHAALIYALVTGLAYRAVDVVRAPIITRILSETRPPPPEAPPPPAPALAPPPPAFVPPPEIHIAKPPPPPSRSNAITAVTPVRPPAAAPIVAAPVRVMPRLDPALSEQPQYPPVSRRLGEQGSLVLQVLVGADGRVLKAKLLKSSGYDRLDQAALDGIKSNYRFVPGTLGGKPQPMWFTFRFTWKLR